MTPKTHTQKDLATILEVITKGNLLLAITPNLKYPLTINHLDYTLTGHIDSDANLHLSKIYNKTNETDSINLKDFTLYNNLMYHKLYESLRQELNLLASMFDDSDPEPKTLISLCNAIAPKLD